MPTSADLLLERVRSATQDEYTIERELGRGGMAAVYLARDISLERRVAIKVMLPDLIGVEGIEDRFVIEARTSAKLDHPGIVTVYSVKQRDGLLFIVMKYVEGRTLEDVMKGDRQLEPGMVTTIVSQVAEALHFAHGEGIVHRDVKPSNIIIDTKGRPIVTDFGIAKITSGRSITVTGSMIGTPAYMSPEQCRGLPATTASDQYSLGVMMYEMLGRRMPFQGTLFELIHAHSNEAPPPLHEIAPEVDAGLEATVNRMLAKNPRDRWESLAEVSKQLTQTKAHHRRTSEVRTQIAELAREPDGVPAPRRPAAAIDLSGAATEVATTPAPQLVVTPAEPTIEVGQTQQLRVSDAAGASLAGVRTVWKSEDPSVATVDENGLVTGRAVGLAKITASGGAAFGRSAITVRPASVNMLAITPQNPEIVTHNEVELRAHVLDARGGTLLGQQIFWASSDVQVCVVSQQGRAIGVAEGSATITATCGDVSGTAKVRVKLPGVERIVLEPGEVGVEVEDAVRLVATVFGANERKLEGRVVTWRSTLPAVAAVDANGNVRGVAPGTAAIIALCEGKEGLASAKVRAQPVVAVRIQPARLQLEAGTSIQLEGVSEDRRGRAVSDTGIDWQSDDTSVALIDASGKVHGVREGRTHVRATSGDVTSSIEVTVVAKPVAQIRIESHAPSLLAGAFATLDATVLDAEGAALSGRVVTWSSSDPSVVTIDASGTCEAKKPGSVRITAACEKARGTTKLSVSVPAPLPPDAPTQKISSVKIDEARARMAAGTSAPAAPPAAVATPRKRSRWMAGVGAVLVLGISGAVWSAMSGGNNATTSPETPASTPTGAPIASNPATVPAETIPQGRENTAAPVAGKAEDPASKSAGNATPPPQPRPQTQPPAVVTPPAQKSTAVETRRDSVPPTSVPVTQAQTAAGGGARRDSVVTPVTPPVVASTPPAGRGATSEADPSRAAACTNPSLPASMLTEALRGDPAARLNAMYQPRDAADGRAKQSLNNALKDLQRLQVDVRSGQSSQASADGCEWVMTLDFSGTNAFGQPRKRSDQVRLSVETTGAGARIKHVSGIGGR